MNGRSSSIEKNIAKTCSKVNHDHYGITFVEVTADVLHWVTYTFTEVSYYCCNNCTKYERYNPKQIREDLLDHYYEKRLEPLLDSDEYCFNTFNDKVKNIVDDAPCIFVINANSLMKVYSGPMLWNKIETSVFYSKSLVDMFQTEEFCNDSDIAGTDDVQCLKLETEKAYFIFCCCWRNPSNCTYEPRTGAIVESNKKIWQELAKTQNPQSALRMESIDFESDETITIPGLNERRYYCSEFFPYSSSNSSVKSSIAWKKLKAEELPMRYRFCKFTISLYFQNNEAKSIQYKVRSDSEGTCKRAQCRHDLPKCLTDVLRAKTVLIQSTCCCVGNLCSTWTKNVDYKDLTVKSQYFTDLFDSCLHQSTAYLRATLSTASECVRNFDYRFREEIFIDDLNVIKYAFAHKIVAVDGGVNDRQHLSCAIYQTYPLRDPYCHLKKNYESERSILQYYTCKCGIQEKSSKSGKCDAKINSEMLLASSNWSKPTCFFTSITGHRPIFNSGKEISLEEGSEEVTEEIPVCAVAITVHSSGLFYRLYKSHYSHFQQEVAPKKRFFVTKRNNHTTYTILCKSNTTTPCNNIQNLMSHHLTYSIRFHSKTKKPQSYHQCVVSSKPKMKTMKCSLASGCFKFSYHNSHEKLTGCVDKIPELVKTSPDLSPLMWCLQKTSDWSKHRCRAYRGTSNVTASGTLCCCYKDCFVMMDEERGFNPFESV